MSRTSEWKTLFSTALECFKAPSLITIKKITNYNKHTNPCHVFNFLNQGFLLCNFHVDFFTFSNFTVFGCFPNLIDLYIFMHFLLISMTAVYLNNFQYLLYTISIVSDNKIYLL
jgi:hypothetical protein